MAEKNAYFRRTQFKRIAGLMQSPDVNLTNFCLSEATAVRSVLNVCRHWTFGNQPGDVAIPVHTTFEMDDVGIYLHRNSATKLDQRIKLQLTLD